MPRDRPSPPPFEPAWLQRSLDRHLAWGVVFMAALVAGFLAYRLREPDLRSDALREQNVSYQAIGERLYRTSCADCHGAEGRGGDAPTLNAKEFLESVVDDQMGLVIAGGIPGSDMEPWSVEYGGTMTAEQIRAVVVYVRAWEPDAPSVPDWRQGEAESGASDGESTRG